MEPRRFIQVLAGPRQVGKTTLVRQIAESIAIPSHYASADDPGLRDDVWLEQQWNTARALARGNSAGAILVLDEVQKIGRWSEAVKRLWDEDSGTGVNLRVVVLGSAPLLVQRGVTESLAGRFEIIRLTHWSFAEMQEAFGWELDQYIFFGGYPGAAPLISDENRWSDYIRDSLIETTISRDVLLLTRVDKPALLRRLFQLACVYSGQILSLTKIQGELQDAGNVTTLAHYLELLRGAGMVTGLQKFSGASVRRRASSPKLQVFNTALMSTQTGLTFAEGQANSSWWGRLVESAVGAHLANNELLGRAEVFYWREGQYEVDFVVRTGEKLTAIEVKSGPSAARQPGMAAFLKKHPGARAILVGPGGIPIEEYLRQSPEAW